MRKITKELQDLKDMAQDIYNEGYHCGVNGPDADLWFEAYAMAMREITKGADYSDDLVIQCFRNIRGVTSRRNQTPQGAPDKPVENDLDNM